MKRWAALYGLGIIVIIVLADAGRLGLISIINHIPYADKVGHFVLYGGLSLLVNLAAIEQWSAQNSRRVAIITSLVLAALIGLEELSQRWYSTRTSSVFDLAASYLGLALFAWLAVRITERRTGVAG